MRKKNPDISFIATKLKEALAKTSINKNELSVRSGLAKPTINSILDGGDTSISTLVRICEALNIPISFFTEDLKNEKEEEKQLGAYEIYQLVNRMNKEQKDFFYRVVLKELLYQFEIETNAKFTFVNQSHILELSSIKK